LGFLATADDGPLAGKLVHLAHRASSQHDQTGAVALRGSPGCSRGLFLHACDVVPGHVEYLMNAIIKVLAADQALGKGAQWFGTSVKRGESVKRGLGERM